MRRGDGMEKIFGVGEKGAVEGSRTWKKREERGGLETGTHYEGESSTNQIK